MSELKDLQERALDIRAKYEALNAKSDHDTWNAKEYMMGFVGDVGDLTKLVMAKENLRDIEGVDAKLQHELGDCLWSILVLSDKYGVDLEQAFQKTMDELDERIKKAMA